MRIYKNIEQIKKDFPHSTILEDEAGFWVCEELQPGYIQKVDRYLKPRTKTQIKDILSSGHFPDRLIDIALFKIKETESIKKIRESRKNGAVLEGRAGVGKSVACTWKIAKMVYWWKVQNPLYISSVLFDTKIFETFQEHDAYLIDDLLPNLKDIKVDLITQIIYYAESKNIPLYITTNSMESFTQFPEPLMSRLKSYCEYIKIKQTKDLRIESVC
jgi:hypothetical protein